MTSDGLIYFAPFPVKSKMTKPCHRHFPAPTASCWFRVKIVKLAARLGATSFPADPRDEVDSETESETESESQS